MHISDINTLTPVEIAQSMARAQAMNQNYFQFRHRLADGSIRDVEVCSGPVRLKQTNLLYSIVFDVTARKRMERIWPRPWPMPVNWPSAAKWPTGPRASFWPT